MTQVKLSCGFEAEVDEDAVNDMQFLDAISDFEDSDGKSILALNTVSRLLLSREDKEKLYGLLRNEQGRVPVDVFGAAMTELIQQLYGKKK